MKKSIFLFSIIILLVGCSDNTSEINGEENGSLEENSQSDASDNGESSENIMSGINVEEGLWIGQAGVVSENEDMVLTDNIAYDSSSSYIMNNTSYVTYQDGDEILQTILYSEGAPEITLEAVEEADNIRISTQKYKLENFELIKE